MVWGIASSALGFAFRAVCAGNRLVPASATIALESKHHAGHASQHLEIGGPVVGMDSVAA